MFLQLKFTATAYCTMSDFQGSTIIFVDSFNNYNQFYQIVAPFATNRCVINIKTWAVIYYALGLNRLSHFWIADLHTAQFHGTP